MSYAPGQNYQLRYTLAVAMVLHGLLIFGITVGGIVTAKAPSADMEVTLSLQSSEEAPESAEFLASQNQLASGDGEQNDELTTTQQPLIADTRINAVDPYALPESTMAAQQDRPYRIITTIARTAWQIATRHSETAIEEAPEIDYSEKSLAELSLAIASLEARLAEKQQPESRKPRTLRLTSTSALASENADYVRQWRNRVENIGNLNYPQLARERQMRGDVRMLVGIQASGVVDEITLLSSSGEDVLDRAAMASIELASPFEPFPSSLASRYDRIEVIRTWQFRHDRLQPSAL